MRHAAVLFNFVETNIVKAALLAPTEGGGSAVVIVSVTLQVSVSAERFTAVFAGNRVG